MKVLNALKEAVLYGLLIVIGIVFSLPLLWMMITSVKVDREFMDASRLLPEMPRPAAVSPYLIETHGEEGAAPERIAWWEEQLREIFGAAVTEKITAGVSREAAAMAGGEEITSRDQVEFILDRSWRRVVRETVVGQPVLRSRERRTWLYENEGGWSAEDSPGAEVQQPLRPFENAQLVTYDFQEAGDSFALSFSMRLDPEAVGQVDEIVLPVYTDDSWHRVYLTLETEEGAWRSRQPFYLLLTSGGWTDFTWRSPDFERSRLGYHYYRPLQPAAREGEPLEEGEVRLTLRVERSGILGALWGKISRNYELVFSAMPFARYLLNSLLLVVLNVIAAVLSCSLAAYAFARLRWRGREIYFIIMLGTMALPPQVTMVPTFIIMRHLGFYNTYFPLVLPSMIAVPFFVFLLRQFLKNVPRDLEDAAMIDGCSHLRIYWSIMLPLIRPTLVIVVIFSFIASWNDFLGPLIYLSDQNLYPVSLGIFAFQSFAAGVGIGSPAVMMAASTLMVLPVIAVFFFAQRYFTQGIKMSGLK